MTRCIGDSDCMFVIPEPAFSTYPVPEAGGAVVACSDGVWDHLGAQEAAMSLLTRDYDGATSAAGQIMQAAISRGGLTDDTTVLCMLFGPPLAVFAPPLAAESDVLENGAKSKSPNRRPSNSFIQRRTSRSTTGNGADPSAAASRPSSVLDNLPAPPMVAAPPSPSPLHVPEDASELVVSPFDDESATDGIAGASVRGGTRYKPRFGDKWDHDSMRGGNMYVDFAEGGGEASHEASAAAIAAYEQRHAVGDTTRPLVRRDSPSSSSPSRGEGMMLAPEADQVVWAASKGVRGSASPLKLPQTKGSASSPTLGTSSRWSNGSRSMSRSLLGSSGGTGSGVDDRWNTSHHTQVLPWHGHGVSGSAPSNRTAEGTGWKRNKRPNTPVPTWQAVDASLMASYEHSHGAHRPSKVVTFAQLGTLKYLGEGESATAHAIEIKGKRLAVKMLKPANCGVPSAVSGIKREIMLMNLMQHAHVLSSVAMGEHEGIPFVVLEVLSSVLSRDLPRPADSVPFWVRQIKVIGCGHSLSEYPKPPNPPSPKPKTSKPQNPNPNPTANPNPNPNPLRCVRGR